MRTIGIDLCNTIADINGLLEKILGPNPEPSCYIHPKLTSGFFEENLWVFEKAEPIFGSKDVLNYLANFYKIVYITKRPNIAKEVSVEWLNLHRFPQGEIYCTQNKVGIARKLDIDFALEDSPYEIDEYLKAGINVFVKSQPYNTNYSARFEWDNFCFDLLKKIS